MAESKERGSGEQMGILYISFSVVHFCVGERLIAGLPIFRAASIWGKQKFRW